MDVRDVGAGRRRSKAPSGAGTPTRRQEEEDEDASTLGVWSSEFRRLQRGHRTVGSGTGGETIESESSRSRREKTKCGSLEYRKKRCRVTQDEEEQNGDKKEDDDDDDDEEVTSIPSLSS